MSGVSVHNNFLVRPFHFLANVVVDLCTIDLDGASTLLPKYAPILVSEAGDWVLPQNEDEHSVVQVQSGDILFFTCPETYFENPDLQKTDLVIARLLLKLYLHKQREF